MSEATLPLDDLAGTARFSETEPSDRASAPSPQSLVEGRSLIRASDPHDLLGELVGDELRLTWRWPDGPQIEQCVVVWRVETWPDGPDGYSGHVFRVSRRSYELQDGLQLDVPPDLPLVYVRVYATLQESCRSGFETWLYSPGDEPTSRRLIKRTSAVLAHYFPRQGRTRAAMELYTVDGGPLPQLVVVHGRSLPLRPAEGVEIASYSGGETKWMLLLPDFDRSANGSWLRAFSTLDGFTWRAERCAVQIGRNG